MSQVIRDEDASRDLLELWLYIAKRNPAAADALLETIHQTCQLLAENPGVGQARPELAPHVRSFSVGNYVLFFRPCNDGIELVRVLHDSRDIDAIFRDNPK